MAQKSDSEGKRFQMPLPAVRNGSLKQIKADHVPKVK